jgi:hypothetical protein
MTTDQSFSQPRLSTDLETLHARLKDKALTLAELKQALKGRGSAILLILLALSRYRRTASPSPNG